MLSRRFPTVWFFAATAWGCQNLTVVTIEVDNVVVSPANLTLIEGESGSLQAQPRGAAGELLQGRTVSWSSDAPAVVVVDGAGNLTAGNAGQTTIRATAEGVMGSASVTVLPGPSIDLSTREVALVAVEGASSASVDVGITNGGNGLLTSLSVAVTYPPFDPSGWLTAGLNGTTAPTSVTIGAFAAALSAGSYSATVAVSSPLLGGLSETISVILTVTPAPPRIVLDPDEVALGAVQNGQEPAEQVVNVTNGGSGVLTGLTADVVYAPGQVAGWLELTLASGTAPTTMTLSATPGALAPQTYNATVRVTSAGADNSPLELTVTFTVAPALAERGQGGSG